MLTYDAGKLIDEARGYRDLGLYEEAEAALRDVISESPEGRDCAQCQLIFLLNGLSRFEEVAELGADLIARGVFVYERIIDTMLALHFLGRIEEARDTLRLVEKSGHPLSDDAYQMAGFAARLGEFPEAVRWLAVEFRRSTEYHGRAFNDVDLQPLWSWLSGHEPGLDEAHAFMEIPFENVSAAALDHDAPVELSADELRQLGERERRLFRFDFNVGYFAANAAAIAADPRAYAEVIRLRRKRVELADQHVRAAPACRRASAGRAAEVYRRARRVGEPLRGKSAHPLDAALQAAVDV